MKIQNRTLCIFSNILGLKSLSEEARAALEANGVDADYLYVGTDDFKKYGGGALSHFSQSWEGLTVSAEVIKRSERSISDYDVIFVISHQIAAALVREGVPAKTRLVIWFDSTPRMAHRLKRTYLGLRRTMLSTVGSLYFDAVIFRKMFRRADALLALSQAAADSVIRDYGVDAEKVRVVYTPVDVRSPKTSMHTPCRLLFVGNDFYRKGGDILVKLFEKELAVDMELYIVSKDAAAQMYSGRKGIHVLGGLPRDEVLNLYREMDIFVFPTLRDDGGIALCEALAAGLPVVTRNAGAQGEWVTTGYNGVLMDYESSASEWAKAIREIAATNEAFARYSRNSIEVAHRTLDRCHFQSNLFAALGSA